MAATMVGTTCPGYHNPVTAQQAKLRTRSNMMSLSTKGPVTPKGTVRFHGDSNSLRHNACPGYLPVS